MTTDLIIFSIVGGLMVVIVMVMLVIVVRLELTKGNDGRETHLGGDNKQQRSVKKIHCHRHCTKHINEN